MSASYVAMSADGHAARWATWSGDHVESLTITWENEAWTASGVVGRERVQYVLRLSPSWQVRQFLLFRDLEQADLWLATDGSARWGEMNGAHRTELDGCYDLQLACTPFTYTLPIRRLPLQVGDRADISVVTVDVDTLGVVPRRMLYSRLGPRRWEVAEFGGAEPLCFDVDQFGLALDVPGQFRRLP